MFKGIQKVSLIDFPGRVACTLFTGGCNFRCPWCHNLNLVEPECVGFIPDISEETVKKYLLSRRSKLQGVCITGGEPTLWCDKLLSFLLWCKSEGFETKLDTNGYLPEVLELFVTRKAVDFIAMDIKNTFPKYAATTGMTLIDHSKLLRSIEIIRESGVEHQFRTTVVTGQVDPVEIMSMEALEGETVVFQEYRNVEELLIMEAERRG